MRLLSTNIISIISRLLLALISVLSVACGPVIRHNQQHIDSSVGIEQRTDVTDAKVKKLTQQLQNSGVRVISLGQDYKLSFPSQLVFYHNSPRIRWGSYPLLNTISAYLSQFRKVSVRVSVYMTGCNLKRSNALATARAENVVEYLSSQVIDARLIYTHGVNAFRVPQKGKCQLKSQVPEVVIAFRNTIE